MATVKISALPGAGPLVGPEEVPLVQGGVTAKTTAQDIANLAAAPPSLPLSLAQGGTGETTAQLALDALFAGVGKGTIIVGDGTHNTPVAVGANGDVLTADNTQPNGVKWAAAAAGGVTDVNGIAGSVTLSGTTNQVDLVVTGSTVALSLPSFLQFAGSVTVQGAAGQLASLQASGAQVTADTNGDVSLSPAAGRFVALYGEMESNKTAAATTPGAIVSRLAIYAGGALVGYLPIYDTIT